MSLIFNEAALLFLLESPEGPVGRRLDRVANHVAGRYEAVVGVVWENRDPSIQPKVDYDVRTAEDGLEAVIGITDGGSISRYMAEKMEIEQDRLVGAIMTTWDTV